MQISEDEITFLTWGDDPYDDNVVLKKLFHPNLKLLIVTEGSAGCRYYTKVCFPKSHLTMMSHVFLEPGSTFSHFIFALFLCQCAHLHLHSMDKYHNRCTLFS